jgi:lactoylglutathione lyase
VADDVDAAHATALAAGCTPLSPPTDKPHGQRVAYVRDPFGTLVELATAL